MFETWHWDRFSPGTSVFPLSLLFHQCSTHIRLPRRHIISATDIVPRNKMTHLETTTTDATIFPITAITMLHQLLIYRKYYHWPHRHTHFQKHHHNSVTTIDTIITTSTLSSSSSSSIIVAETKLDLTLHITLFRVRMFILVYNVRYSL